MEEHKDKWADHYPQEILDLSWSNTSEEQVKNAYKIWADDYEKWALGSEEGSSAGYRGHITCAEAFNDAACELYGENKKNLKILDLGCGTGLAGKILKERFGFTNLVGLDVSEDMLEKAKKREIYNKFIYAFVSNEKVDEIQNAEFDAVVASGVFTTGLIIPDAFDEITRWIKPGGFICFTCPVFNKEENGYKEKCSSLVENKKWKLISNLEADYYGDKIPYGRGYKSCRMLVYKILAF